MPSYLEEVDAGLDLWDNVRNVILHPIARLADEPAWLRFADLRSDAIYSSILRAIALGNHRPSKIARAVGKGRADEIKYILERLCDLRLVERVIPIHEAHQHGSKHALYLLADHYVAFWYRYIDRLRHLLATRRHGDAILQIQADFDKFVSEHAFEDISRQFMWRTLVKDRFPKELGFDMVGSWWMSDEDEKDRIDVVAMSKGRAVLVGECKWSRQQMDRRDLDGLRAALRKATPDLDPIDRPWKALFSRSGFSEDLKGEAADREERLLLFDPDHLYR